MIISHQSPRNAMRKIARGLVLGVLFVGAATVSVNAQQDVKRDEVRRERMNKINKVWDEQIERIRRIQIEAGCKVEAKKQYSAIRFRKRRLFLEDCIDKATAPASAQSIHLQH
jgi:hypothetical protein